MVLPFHLLSSYSSLRVLLVGMATALSFTGTGMWLVEKLAGKRLPLHIALPTGTLLGIHVFSVLVQTSGFLRVATPGVLRSLWLAQVLVGLPALGFRLRVNMRPVFDTVRKIGDEVRGSRATLLCALMLALSVFVTLLVSLAPSTKIDELYYHMLAPLRLLQDGALNYYREPWPAMLPHMHFQITAAPLYALGVVDGLNVTSWWLGTILAWFCAAVVLRKTGDIVWALLVSLGLYAGMYAPVWFVTGGAGAVSVLSMTVLAFIVLDRREMIETLGGFPLVIVASVLSAMLAASKLSYIPFAVLGLTICSFSVWRSTGYKSTLRIAILAWSSWIVLYLPAMVWTWASSGYPLGATQDPSFAQEVASTRLIYHSIRGFFTQIAIHLADHTPLVWGGCALFLLSPAIRKDRGAWLTGTALLLFQGTAVVLKLPITPRFLGGLPHALALFFWMQAARNAPNVLKSLFGSKRAVPLLLALLTPWVLVQLWYSGQFLPVVLGTEPVEAFAERLIPLYEDYVELDRLLPEEAVLFVEVFRISSVYAPRPVVFDKRDIRPELDERPLYLLYRSPSRKEEAWGSAPAESVYRNDEAKIWTFRTPGRPPVTGPLEVWRLTGPDGKRAVE